MPEQDRQRFHQAVRPCPLTVERSAALRGILIAIRLRRFVEDRNRSISITCIGFPSKRSASSLMAPRSPPSANVANLSAILAQPKRIAPVRAMESPIPMPFALLVKNGSKTSFNLTSGMPEPRRGMSDNAITTPR